MVGYCCQWSKPTEHNIGAENRELGLEDGADSPESLWSPPYTAGVTPVASGSCPPLSFFFRFLYTSSAHGLSRNQSVADTSEATKTI